MEYNVIKDLHSSLKVVGINLEGKNQTSPLTDVFIRYNHFLNITS
jgi:hypothetical protein